MEAPSVRSVVRGENKDLIPQVMQLWANPDRDGESLVLDMTYGKGNFWTEYRPAVLNEFEGDFTQPLPYPGNHFSVVVFDPPHIAPGGRRTSTIPGFNMAYGLDLVPATVLDTQAMMLAGMLQARRVLEPKGIFMVKCSNYVTSGKFYKGHDFAIDAATLLGFEQVDEFILERYGPGPQPKKNPDGTKRVQKHSRATHSFLCIFRKKK